MPTLEERVAALEAIVARMGAVFSPEKTVATERELDSTYGDPQVSFVPREWNKGGVAKGQKFSACPAEFLDLYAEVMDEFAVNNDAKGARDNKNRPKSYFDKKNARFARGWAKRLRSGWTPPSPVGFANGSLNPFGATNGIMSDGRSPDQGDAWEPPSEEPMTPPPVTNGQVAHEDDEDELPLSM